MLEILTDMSDGPDDTMCECIENLISIQRSSVENEVRETKLKDAINFAVKNVCPA